VKKSGLFVILDNIRSLYNVGSLFRTADALGVSKIYLCGLTPYPSLGKSDPRRIGVQEKAQRGIGKTALGAEKTVPFEHYDNCLELIQGLKRKGVFVVGLENTKDAIDYRKANYKNPSLRSGTLMPCIKFPLALVLGHEREGIGENIIKACDLVVKIPMFGKKKSLNVSVAFGVAGYEVVNKFKSY